MILKRITEFASRMLLLSNKPKPAQIYQVYSFDGQQPDKSCENRQRAMQHIERLIRTTAAILCDSNQQEIDDKANTTDKQTLRVNENIDTEQPVNEVIKRDMHPVSPDNPLAIEEIQAVATLARRLKSNRNQNLNKSSVA